MLRWALIFLVVALVAALFGFGGIAAGAAGIAKILFFVIALVAALFGFGGIAAGAAEIAKVLFFIFLVIAVVTFIASLIRKT